MSDDATRNLNTAEKLDVLLARVASIDARVDSIDARVASIDARVNSIDARVDSIDTRVGSIDTRVSSIDTRVGSIDARLTTLETDAPTTRPIWERALAEILETRSEMKLGFERSDREIRHLGRKIAALGEDLLRVRADQRDLGSSD